MSSAACDFEGAVCGVREILFQFVGALRLAETVAQEDHAVFKVAGLPGLQKVIRGGERESITRLRDISLIRGMAMRLGAERNGQK